jgi:hypothetical protein
MAVWARTSLRRLSSFEKLRGLEVDGKLDKTVWSELGGDNSGDVLTRNKVTPEDLEGPFAGEIPGDYRQMASMERLDYASPAEMFSERFHMEEELLKQLNPEIGSVAAGDEIVAANVEGNAKGKVIAIRVEKSNGKLLGLDREGKLLVSYPATIGSRSRPLGYRPPAPETILPPAVDLSYASLRPAQTLALECRLLT